ncbi:MAG: M14 metallopeptidase family protein [Bryobacteraceae bacterium]
MARLLLLAVCLARVTGAAVPSPADHLGYRPGADFQLADYQQIIGYFQRLASVSGRIRLVDFGKSAEGRSTYVAFISDEGNLKKLDRLREINRRLALGRATMEEAGLLAEEGRAIVWIDSGMHASEIAPVQHAPELAYRMISSEDEETRNIRRNVILMQVPVINPDGLEMVVHWYRRNRGTPYELAPLPRLYQKYSGHDNNRDWFMLNLVETRNVTRLLFQEWFPHIVYNQHQQPPFPARIFVPPYAEPLNPNIPAAVMEGIHRIGSAMKERFALENKPGVLSYHGFDGWWNGGLRSTPAFHNMHGILTETAGNQYAEPREYDAAKFERLFTNGIPSREPSIFYQRPWMGGRWTLRDSIEYMLTADFAILDTAANDRRNFLLKAYRLAVAAAESSKPYAYVVSRQQWDRSAAPDMLERLAFAGIEVKRAQAEFRAQGRTYPEGSFVLPAAQPFRAYLVDLMEGQKYPELKAGQNGPTKRPYDIAGWTLPMLMGVRVDRIDSRFDAVLEAVSGFETRGIVHGQGPVVTLDHREANAYLAMNFFLGRSEPVRWAADGTIFIESPYVENEGRAVNLANQFGIAVHLKREKPSKLLYELRTPKVAVYESWVPNMDAGWTRFVLDRFQIGHTLLHNDDVRRGRLRDRFDTIILPSQTPNGILHGAREGETIQDRNQGASTSTQRPEYAGGIGLRGLNELEQFVREGGTLIALDQSAELAIEHFPLSLRNAAKGAYAPGSLLRMNVDGASALAFGMPPEITAFTTTATGYEVTVADGHNKDERLTRAVVSYPQKELLASGWLSGEKSLVGKASLVDARHGKGRVIVFGFRPQFRGQTLGTFKLLLNAIYLGSAQPL